MSPDRNELILLVIRDMGDSSVCPECIYCISQVSNPFGSSRLEKIKDGLYIN